MRKRKNNPNIFIARIVIGIFAFSLYTSTSFAQNIAINTTGAAAANCAIFDVSSSSLGVLFPRVVLTNVTTYLPLTGAAVDGLMVYSTAAPTGGNGTGYYYWSTVSARWVSLVDNLAPGTPWQTNGNAGTVAGTNFIGTTDNVSLDLRSNNQIQVRLLNTGQVGINYIAPPATDYLSVQSDATYNYAVNGYCTSAPLGNGLWGEISAATNQKASIWGDCFSTDPNASGALGQYIGASGTGNGIYGFTNLTTAVGVHGYKPAGGTGWGGAFYNDLGWTGFHGAISDRKLKKDISPLTDAINIIKKFTVYTYRFKVDEYPNLGEDINHFGFMSQDVEQFVPELVKEKDWDLLNTQPNEKDKFIEYKPFIRAKAINYIEVIPILVQAMKEQEIIIEDLKKQNIDLIKKIEEVEKKVNSLNKKNW